MTYKVNGTEITLQPESGAWQPRRILNLDGNGHPVYPPTREFEMQWSFMTLAELDQLHTFFLSVGTTGSAIVDLPGWNTDPYAFKSYTGCVLQEPVFEAYDNYYVTNVRLAVTKIRT